MLTHSALRVVRRNVNQNCRETPFCVYQSGKLEFVTTMVSLSAISVASSQPQLENIKWKNSRNKQLRRIKLHAVLSRGMKSQSVSLWICYPFVQHVHTIDVIGLLIIIQGPSELSDLWLQNHSAPVAASA